MALSTPIRGRFEKILQATNSAQSTADLAVLGIERGTALALLNARDAFSGRQFPTILELLRSVVFPDFTDFYLHQYLPQCAQDRPALLVPIRLETRVKDGSLLIRVYPDDISLAKHDPRLSPKEVEAGTRYLAALQAAAASTDDSSDAERDAWRTLAAQLGVRRAAWVRKVIDDHDSADPDQKRPEEWIEPARVRNLPDRFVFYLYNVDGDLAHDPVEGILVQPDLPIFARLSAGSLFEGEALWVVDFDAARAAGMAVSVRVSALNFGSVPNKLSRIVAVGLTRAKPEISQDRLERLLEFHHFDRGIAFLDPDSPTNNLPEAKSAYSSVEDYDGAYDVEVVDPPQWGQNSQFLKPNAERLGAALGLGERPEVLRNVEGSGKLAESYAGEMNTALWPVTGYNFFRYMLEGVISEKDLIQLGDHFRQFVRAGGPLPTIRVGTQPYGVLPVTRIESKEGGHPAGWASSDLDWPSRPALDQNLHTVLGRLYPRWRNRANDPALVPRIRASDDPVADPDQDLLGVLSMRPVSVSVEARPFVDERFVAWALVAMRNRIFGEGTVFGDTGIAPAQWVQNWSEAWRNEQARIRDTLGAIGVVDADLFDDTALTKVFGWWNSQAVENLTVEEEGDDPRSYLTALCAGNQDTERATLLHDMLSRAITLEANEYGGTQAKDAICRMAASSALEFFNNVTTVEAIVETIKDDPHHQIGPPRAYGVRKTLAERILAARDAKPGKAFESLAEIDAIFGVGPDTLHDIVYTFRDRPHPADFDLLFRQTLDLFNHRLDAWYTSLAFKRLESMRRTRPDGIHIGAYGYVEDLNLSGRSPVSEGFVHTPSPGQTAAASVLHNAYLTHPLQPSGASPFAINLTSERVRGGMRLLQGIREGQPLGAMLGFQFERGLADGPGNLMEYVDEFREGFPTVAGKLTPSNGDSAEAVAARNVVDGTALVRAWRASTENDGDADVQDIRLRVEGLVNGIPSSDRSGVTDEMYRLLDSEDAVGDLLMYEAIYEAVQGNHDAAGAALEAASGNAHPPEIHSIKTNVAANTLEHRIAMLFPVVPAPAGGGPREAAEPKLAHWFTGLLPALDQIGCSYSFVQRSENDAGAAPGIPPLVLNQATPQELAALLVVAGIKDPQEILDAQQYADAQAQLIVDHLTANGDFAAVSELGGVVGIDAAAVEALRGRVTMANTVVTLEELDITAIDLFYITTVPLEGAETDIEQRVRRVARARDWLPRDHRIQLNLKAPPGFNHGLERVAEFSRLTLDLIAQATALQPGSLAPSVEADGVLHSEADYDEIHGRAQGARDGLETRQAQLEGLLPPAGDAPAEAEEAPLTASQRVSIDAQLLELSRWGIPGTVPPWPDEAGLLQRARAVLKEAAKRVRDADLSLTLPAAGQERNFNALVAERTAALKHLFGRGFVVMPIFLPTSVDDLLASFDRLEALGGTDDHRIRLWLQQEAAVHPALERFDDWLMVAEAWSNPLPDAQDYVLNVAQLPAALLADQHWVGLPDGERDGQARPRDAFSVVTLGAGSLRGLDAAAPKLTAGLMIHRCRDQVQEEEVTTSVGFHYDAPNAQAPQCLLLAVPPQRSEQPENWSEANLEGIVRSAIDLAKIRAVDLDALSGLVGDDVDTAPQSPAEDTGLGGILPSLFVPADPSKPGWARDIIMGSFEDWLVQMQATVVDFMGQTIGQDFDPAIETSGIEFLSLTGDPLQVYGFSINPQPIPFGRVIVASGNQIECTFPRDVNSIELFLGSIQGSSNPTFTALDGNGQSINLQGGSGQAITRFIFRQDEGFNVEEFPATITGSGIRHLRIEAAGDRLFVRRMSVSYT